eukprot:234046_1
MTSMGASKKLKKLEEDFNGGDPIDLTGYQNVLAIAGSMGFNTEDCLEAALVTGTTENLQLITDYILASPDEKKKKYNKKKAESVKEIKLNPEQEKAIEELKRLNREIQQEQFKIHQLEEELQARQAVTKLEKLTEYVRGICADESVTETEATALDKYMKKENIDDKTYEDALNKLDLTPMDMEDLKNKKHDTGGKMCVQCSMNPKQMVILPCMHVVMCADCAKEAQAASGPGAGCCPVCDKEFTDIQKVYIE